MNPSAYNSPADVSDLLPYTCMHTIDNTNVFFVIYCRPEISEK